MKEEESQPSGSRRLQEFSTGQNTVNTVIVERRRSLHYERAKMDKEVCKRIKGVCFIFEGSMISFKPKGLEKAFIRCS